MIDGVIHLSPRWDRVRSCGPGWAMADRLGMNCCDTSLFFPLNFELIYLCDDETVYSVDARWKGAQNALAGLFCASLGSMDALRTTAPTRAFPPLGALPRLHSPHTHRLRHATLPAEHVCTENLTPFLKLLPCPANAGIAALLNPHRLFDADWHGLGVDVMWIAGRGIELRLTVQAVFDPVRTSAERRRGETDFSRIVIGC
jgi:hypothetical protein